MRRPIRYILLGAAGTAAAAVAAALTLPHINLAALAAARLTAAWHRPVTIASLHVTPGRWLTLTARGIRVANLPGGSQPDMAALASLTAKIDLLSLLTPPLRFRRLEIGGLSLLMEHVAGGGANWRPDGAAEPPKGPQDRSWFPLLLDAHMTGSDITYRTSKGKALVTRLDDATIHTTDAAAPIHLAATGRYRDVPMRLDITLQSTTAMRKTAVPVPTVLRLTSGTTALQFDGTVATPLKVDGATGRVTLDAPSTTPILGALGSSAAIDLPLTLSGTLTRSGPLWRVTDVTGRITDAALAASTLRLTEGAYGQPGTLDLDLVFDRIDAATLLAPHTAPDHAAAWTIDPQPDPQVDAHLHAAKLAYGKLEAGDVDLAGSITPGRIKLDRLALHALDAQMEASGQASLTQQGNQLDAEASLSGLNIADLGRQLGTAALPVAGALNARLATAAVGTDLAAAARAAPISVVVWMGGGRIARTLIDEASTNVLRLFSTPTGTAAIACALAIAEIRDGAGTLASLRIRTADGTILASGHFDLNRDQLDLTGRTAPATTSDFALDVPFRITGPFRRLHADPAIGGAPVALADPARLPPALSQAARDSHCD